MRPVMSGIRDLGIRNESWDCEEAHFLREALHPIVTEREQRKRKIVFSLLRRGSLPMKAIFNFTDTGFFVKRERQYFDTAMQMI